MDRDEPMLHAPLRAALDRVVGKALSVRAIGRSGSSHIVETEKATLVIKRMSSERSPAMYAERFGYLSSLEPLIAPNLVAVVDVGDCWYAVFEHIEGSLPSPGDGGWSSFWQRAFDLLVRLRSLPNVPVEWRLESTWLDCLSNFAFGFAPAEALLNRLLGTQPLGPRTWAHGDFSGQNLIMASHGLVLIDWEDLGSAPAGFDAGWLLALNRLGAGPQVSPLGLFGVFNNLGFPEENLRWFEALGLLRLLYRAKTLNLPPPVEALIVQTTQIAIASYD